MNELFLKAVPVLEKIENAGFEAYFVGGSVRDFLLGKKIEDVDIATSALPEEIKSIFSKTVDLGIEHGTVLVLYHGESYEITTFRSEGVYEDFRRPKEVAFIRSLHEDLKRRDFTMNAIAMTKSGELIDPFLGREDIKRQIIRTVGPAEERFTEDALRMMRAIRFVSQLAFQLEEETFQALKKYAPLLEHIATERKLVEFNKLLTGKNCGEALQIMVEQQLHHYLPYFNSFASEINKVSTYLSENSLSKNESWALMLYVMNTDDTEKILRSWKMSLKDIKEIQGILRALSTRFKNPLTSEYVYQFGLPISLHAEKLFSILKNEDMNLHTEKIKTIYDALPIKSRKELVITGNDLMNWEKKRSGPWIKEKLEEIEKAILNGEIRNEKEEIKEWLFS